LQRSNDQLRESNQELDAFAHTVAHDLKGQLTVIDGYAEITVELCDDSTPAEIQEYLNEILRGTDRMARVLNGLILLARTRQEEVVLTRIDTGRSVACALESLSTGIRKRAAVVIVPDTWPAAV